MSLSDLASIWSLDLEGAGSFKNELKSADELGYS